MWRIQAWALEPDSLGLNPTRPCTSCVILDKLFRFSVPQSLHLQKQDNSSTFFTGLLEAVNEIMYLRILAQCNKC